MAGNNNLGFRGIIQGAVQGLIQEPAKKLFARVGRMFGKTKAEDMTEEEAKKFAKEQALKRAQDELQGVHNLSFAERYRHAVENIRAAHPNISDKELKKLVDRDPDLRAPAEPSRWSQLGTTAKTGIAVAAFTGITNGAPYLEGVAKGLLSDEQKFEPGLMVATPLASFAASVVEGTLQAEYFTNKPAAETDDDFATKRHAQGFAAGVAMRHGSQIADQAVQRLGDSHWHLATRFAFANMGKKQGETAAQGNLGQETRLKGESAELVATGNRALAETQSNIAKQNAKIRQDGYDATIKAGARSADELMPGR